MVPVGTSRWGLGGSRGLEPLREWEEAGLLALGGIHVEVDWMVGWSPWGPVKRKQGVGYPGTVGLEVEQLLQDPRLGLWSEVGAREALRVGEGEPVLADSPMGLRTESKNRVVSNKEEEEGV